MAAVSHPLNYINGQRVESSSENTEDDIHVLEPATGLSISHSYALSNPTCTQARGLG